MSRGTSVPRLLDKHGRPRNQRPKDLRAPTVPASKTGVRVPQNRDSQRTRVAFLCGHASPVLLPRDCFPRGTGCLYGVALVEACPTRSQRVHNGACWGSVLKHHGSDDATLPLCGESATLREMELFTRGFFYYVSNFWTNLHSTLFFISPSYQLELQSCQLSVSERIRLLPLAAHLNLSCLCLFFKIIIHNLGQL